MKKIYTLMFLTLLFLLSACNVNSSIQTTSDNASSSSINSSLNANVSRVEISTNSSLNQFLGLTQRVRISATVAGDNYASVEWYLDDVRSTTQTGVDFEFLPTEVKTYQIFARVGNVKSNTISVNVSFPSFNILSLSTIDSSTIELSGEQGLTFSIQGLTIANTSSFNLASQKYTLKLLTPMISGTTYTIRIFKQGYNELVRSFTYENRKLDVGYIQYDGKRVLPNQEGLYTIEKPFDDDEDSNPDTFESLLISMSHSNLEGLAVPVSFLVKNPNNQIDSTKSVQQTRAVLKSTNVDHTFNLSEEELVGLFIIDIKVGEVTKQIRLNVINPVPSVGIESVVVYDLARVVSNEYAPLLNPFVQTNDEYNFDTVEPNAANEYVIFKPYNGGAYELTFEIEAKNFPVPAAYAGVSFDPHVLSYGIADGKIIRYNQLQDFNTPQGQEPFNRELSGYRITQYIDASTIAGSYNFVFTARLNLSLSSSTTVNFTVKLIIKEYAPALKFELNYNGEEVEPNSGADSTFTVYKPIVGNGLTNGLISSEIFAILENYESPVLPTLRPGVTNQIIEDSFDDSVTRYLLEFNITYSGPVSNIQNVSSKTVVELGQQINSDDVDDDITDEFEIDEVISGAVVTKTYNRYVSEDNDVKIDLTDFISYVTTVNSSTITGNHVFTVKIGQVSNILTIRILEPTPQIIADDTSVLYGPLGSEDDSYVEYDEELDTYFVNMSTLEETDMYLLINVYPFGMTSSPPSYPYTFKKSTPSGNIENITNFVTLTLKTGDRPSDPDPEDEYYDGTLKFPSTGAGSEMKNVSVLADIPGEYLFEYNINNSRKIIKVVLLPSSVLEVESVKFNDQELTSFNGAYLIEGSNSLRSLFVTLKPINIDEDYTYTINQVQTYVDDEDSNIEVGEEDYYEKILIIDLVDSFTVTIDLPAIGSILSGAFEQQKFYIRVYDDNDTLVSLTTLYVYAQKE